jgi:hypothetical protein
VTRQTSGLSRLTGLDGGAGQNQYLKGDNEMPNENKIEPEKIEKK